MNKINQKNILIGAIAGFLLGFIILHPFSMLFKGMIYPSFNFNFVSLKSAFSPLHQPMAMFFGLLGVLIGSVIVLLLSALSHEKEKVKILEGLLPICAWCKKIRDDEGKERGTGDWIEIEQYLQQRNGADFTHGVCDECCNKILEENKMKEGLHFYEPDRKRIT